MLAKTMPLFLALCLCTSSCDSLELTPEEAIAANQFEEQYEAASAKADAWERAARDAEQDAREAIAARNQVDYQAAISTFEATQAEYRSAVAEMVEARAAAADVYRVAAERTVGPLAPVLESLPDGPWKLLTPFLGNIAVLLLSKRGRERTVEAAKSLGKLNLAGFAAGLLKGVGAMHTNVASAAAADRAIAEEKAAVLAAKAETLRTSVRS